MFQNSKNSFYFLSAVFSLVGALSLSACAEQVNWQARVIDMPYYEARNIILNNGWIFIMIIWHCISRPRRWKKLRKSIWTLSWLAWQKKRWWRCHTVLNVLRMGRWLFSRKAKTFSTCHPKRWRNWSRVWSGVTSILTAWRSKPLRGAKAAPRIMSAAPFSTASKPSKTQPESLLFHCS